MFGVNTKEIFQQKLYDVISILFVIHIIAVTINYIIKWIHPYFKKHNNTHYKQKYNYNSKCSKFFDDWCKNKSSRLSSSNEFGEMTRDELVSMFENLKTLIDIADNPTKAILDSSSVTKINMMSDSDFENTLSLGNFLRKLSRRKCSSEVQTNITINPKLKVDYSCPEFLCLDLVSEREIKTCDSSDSFISICSRKSENLKAELDEILNELEGSEDVHKDKIDEDAILQKLKNYLKSSLANNDIASSFGQTGNQVSQENKLLEMALTEFEKELKPIKDQIQTLKECLSGELACKTQNVICPFSDFTSSFTGSGTFTESVSGATTCCSTADLHSYFSSFHIVSATSFGSLETDSKYEKIKKLDKIETLTAKYRKSHHCNNHASPKETSMLQEVSKYSEKCKSKTRSPIAEMYVKLSQCNSQSSCAARNKKEKIPSSDNGVTYRIDLNVNLGGAQTSKSQKSKPLKERSIHPLTSDPDEILGKP